MDRKPSDAPESMKCPITMDVMQDPVMDPEGHTYERSAIEAALAKNPESPMTRTPLTASQLVPNRGLRDAIAEWQSTASSPAAAPAEAANSSAAAASKGGVSLGCSFVDDPLQPGSQLLMLEALTPEATDRVPVDVCCVVDVSGSMSQEAKIQTSEGDGESHGLSMLDIVKHAVRVIIGLLNGNDRLSLVTYSNQATLVFPPINMNDAGKARAMTQVGLMNAYGGTNLWDGLQTALETLRTSEREGRVASIMLLTDGVPNLNPPRGILPMLTRYQKKTPSDAAINTFGFGYNLESELLEAISNKGNGMYSFIPDSGMVGTAFIHSLANSLVQLGKAEVELSPSDSLEVFDPGTVPGSAWPRPVDCGVLQFGASRSLIIRAKVGNNSADLGRAVMKYRTADGTEHTVEAPLLLAKGADTEKVLKHARRNRFVVTMSRVMRMTELAEAQAELVTLREELIKMGANATQIAHPTMPGATVPSDPVLADLDGQVTEAFSREDWRDKWGKHYLRSLVLAHDLEQCTNFKDVGLQAYGECEVFEDLRDQGDEFFNRMDPPEPSVQRAAPRAAQPGAPAAAPVRAPVSMAAYNNCNNPCFSGDSLVQMPDGAASRRVDSIKQGDRVMSCDGTAVRVVCVVKTYCLNAEAALVRLSDSLRITPWHPVRVASEWQFPANLAEAEVEPCGAVYSFVVEAGHSMMIGGVECITLGHGIEHDPVASHPFFGTGKVLAQLTQMEGWERGLVQMLPGRLLRDAATGLVCSFTIDYSATVGPELTIVPEPITVTA